MKKTKGSLPPPSGLVLYAKPSGLTSFSSLWNIKKALGTDKVGHTGTLDSFADGLLVVLSGSLTHLVPHITSFAKTYKAVVCFGRETDTLDPTGSLVKTGKAVSRQQVESVLASFTGAIMQEPPLYSALHVDGKRASDLARDGKSVKIETRAVFIYELSLLDFKEESPQDPCSYALLEVTCSKGTYIRSLARDIAHKLGTAGHLLALRRTAVGPFSLGEAACADRLGDFSIGAEIPPVKKDDKKTFEDIKSHFMNFTPQLASVCGFESDILKATSEKQFANGRPLYSSMFTRLGVSSVERQTLCARVSTSVKTDRIAVFYEDGGFAGMMEKSDGRLSYGFVVPRVKKEFRIFSWDDITGGKFPVEWQSRGCALSVGSFDGMHAGHGALLEAVGRQNLVRGIVTFTSSVHSREEGFEGCLTSLSQKLSVCRKKGLDFAIVIDFSEHFSKMEGQDFISVLVRQCGLKFLAEGSDFRCGYRGALGVLGLEELSSSLGFSFMPVPDVLVEGERVSSSRVRRAVLNADFMLAHKLLSRPFAYDASSLSWKAGDESQDGLWVYAELKSEQILPPCGMYNVVIKTEDSVLHASCSIEEGGNRLGLFVPSLSFAQKVLAVEFVSRT